MDPHLELADGDPRRHLDIELERSGADLGEPEAVLLDEVEGEPVAARRPRRRDREVELDPLLGRDVVRQRGARPVPDDRVAERVEPVVGGVHASRSVSYARSPCLAFSSVTRAIAFAPA